MLAVAFSTGSDFLSVFCAVAAVEASSACAALDAPLLPAVTLLASTVVACHACSVKRHCWRCCPCQCAISATQILLLANLHMYEVLLLVLQVKLCLTRICGILGTPAIMYTAGGGGGEGAASAVVGPSAHPLLSLPNPLGPTLLRRLMKGQQEG